MNLEKLKKALSDCYAKMESLITASETTDMTDEQLKQFNDLKAEASGLKTKIEQAETFLKDKAEAERIVNAAPAVLPRKTADWVGNINPAKEPDNIITIPARAQRWSTNLKSFTGADARVQAHKAGMFLKAIFAKDQSAIDFCRQHGMQISANMTEGTNSAGGYLVPEEYETSIIKLVEQYGIARKLFRRSAMTGDTKNQPRRTGGLTAYFVGEGASGTKSDLSWDSIKLVAKKLMAISVVTNELNSDAIISMADEVTNEIALAFAAKEDLCAFQGDGTSTYGGINGIVNILSTLNGVDDGGGLILGAGNAYSEITDGNFTDMIGRVPNYPGMNLAWVCSKPFFYATMERLARAAGGNTYANMSAGGTPQYAGYPVYFTGGTSVMPVTAANSQIACLFGDFGKAATFGDRSGMSLALSSDATVDGTSVFETDCLAIRGTERFDVNVHDVGTSSAAGAVVGLILAAS